MICQKCGATINDGYAFCDKCGEPVSNGQQENQSNFYQQPSQQYSTNYNQSQGDYQQQSQYNNNQQQTVTPQPVIMPYSVDSNVEKITTIGQYIGWQILGSIIGIIPVLGLILLIVLAVDSSNKNRANYFRSMIVIRLIIYGLAIVGVLIASAIMGSFIFDSFI